MEQPTFHGPLVEERLNPLEGSGTIASLLHMTNRSLTRSPYRFLHPVEVFQHRFVKDLARLQPLLPVPVAEGTSTQTGTCVSALSAALTTVPQNVHEKQAPLVVVLFVEVRPRLGQRMARVRTLQLERFAHQARVAHKHRVLRANLQPHQVAVLLVVL